MLNYFSSSTVFGVIRLSYSEHNHKVTEIARFSKGDFGNVHCNTESVDSNTDWTQAHWEFKQLFGITNSSQKIQMSNISLSNIEPASMYLF